MRPTIAVGLGGSNGWYALAWATEQAMAPARPSCCATRAATTRRWRGARAPGGVKGAISVSGP